MDWYQKGLAQVRALLNQKKEVFTDPGVCCINIAPGEINLVYAVEKAGKMELQWCDSVDYKDRKDLISIFMALSNKHQLANTRIHWVLQPEDYQLLQIEALPIEASEFQQAIRWKIKDLIPFPVEEAIIDSFPMPKQLSTASQNMIMVVVSRANYLTFINEQLRLAGLHLTTIEIPDLTLRNINASYETDGKSTALVYLQDRNCQLIITKQKTLYLTRRLEIGLDILKPANVAQKNTISNVSADTFFLELQRSFDFYQSQWRSPMPAKITLASPKALPDDINAQFAQRFTVPIEQIELKDFIQSKLPLTKMQVGEYLPIIGATLRNEIEHAAAN